MDDVVLSTLANVVPLYDTKKRHQYYLQPNELSSVKVQEQAKESLAAASKEGIAV